VSRLKTVRGLLAQLHSDFLQVFSHFATLSLVYIVGLVIPIIAPYIHVPYVPRAFTALILIVLIAEIIASFKSSIRDRRKGGWLIYVPRLSWREKYYIAIYAAYICFIIYYFFKATCMVILSYLAILLGWNKIVPSKYLQALNVTSLVAPVLFIDAAIVITAYNIIITMIKR
jgi:hypothetical protein